jgi:hypothetical protein
MDNQARGPPDPAVYSARLENPQERREGVSEPYAKTEEYAEALDYLTHEVGVERREAEVILHDGDLFRFIDAGSMFAFEGQEGVRQWDEAVETLQRLEFFFDNPALEQSFAEMIELAKKMLARLKERAGGE